ncbi:MAG: DUF4249 family protein [Bacteroidales bacterium]|nr:DUF4249 family protein [Bacteroidales bacterium]
MKKIFVFGNIVLLLLMAACVERDAGYILHPDEASRLVVNALWTTADSLPTVNICRTGCLQTAPVKDCETELWVNGQCVSNGSDTVFNYRPQPGDHVELLVSGEGEKVSASADVLQPIIIESMDTLHVRKLKSHESNDTKPYVRFMIHLRMPEGMKGMQYFRLELNRYSKVFAGGSCSYGEDGRPRWRQIWFNEEYKSDYEYDFDPALSENASNVSDDDEDDYSLEFFDDVPNKYGLFCNNFFKDGRYTLYVDVPNNVVHSLEDEVGFQIVYHFRIVTLPRIEYYYLWSATALTEVFESGVFFSNPPIIPSNIEGGTGIFSIGAVADVSLDDNQLKEVEMIEEEW